jgi:hypothetical protein
MEEMSHRSELSIIREEQLARLRETTGTPERFVADFACARHDRGFRVTFARFSPVQRFRCESVDTRLNRIRRRRWSACRGFCVRQKRSGFEPMRWISRPCPAPGAGQLALDSLRQMQSNGLRRPQFRAFFHLPRQLRRDRRHRRSNPLMLRGRAGRPPGLP